MQIKTILGGIGLIVLITALGNGNAGAKSNDLRRTAALKKASKSRR